MMKNLFILGSPNENAVGAHFLDAAKELSIPCTLYDFQLAYPHNQLLKKVGWLWDKRPLGLRAFSRSVVEQIRQTKATVFLVTGITPFDETALKELRQWGVTTLNYLTDDPWNPHHRSRWFFRALNQYDFIFSPRESNLQDLKMNSRASVHYLPFAFSPKVHYPAPPTSPKFDIFFAGGADSDRMIYFEKLADAGFSLSLYGGYWEKNQKLRKFARGLGSLAQLREGIASTKICLCLVRRANRDGHAMRTFEIPAMGGCPLVEDTKEHRTIFGANEETALYFSTFDDMIAKAQRLLQDSSLRNRLIQNARALIIEGKNTYADRLTQIANVLKKDETSHYRLPA